jgi:hypothetical protein
MHDGTPRTPRHWKIIAEELRREADPRRVLELSRELNEALDRELQRPPLPLKEPQAEPPTTPNRNPKSGAA